MADFERVIPGDWAFIYKANRHGQIFRQQQGKWIEIVGYKSRNGLALKLKGADGKYRVYQKRRIVYESFNGPLPSNFIVIAKRGSYRLSDLKAIKRADHVKMTASKANQKAVVLLDDDENIIDSWPSAHAAAKDLYLTANAVQYICNNRPERRAANVAWERISDLLLSDKYNHEKKRAERTKLKKLNREKRESHENETAAKL